MKQIKIKLILSFLLAMFLCNCQTSKNYIKNYPYVQIDNPQQSEKSREILKKPCKEIFFPLSKENKKVIKILEEKYDNEVNCAGLAAPQIGFSKRIIIFSVPDDPEIKKYRSDLVQTMPKTIWINPSYVGIEENDKTKDYEGCFSVKDLAGYVERYKTIKYTAYLKDGSLVSGIATGFLARVIQHEIDHINGILCIDRMNKEEIMTKKELRAQILKERLEKSKNNKTPDKNQEQ